jgi:uncharacterized membrane protein
LRLFGNSEAAMRSLGALYSIGSIGCAYGWGRYFLGHRGGLLLAALLGLNPYFLFHSLNIRMYCPLVFWTLLSGWATLELIGGINSRLTKKELTSTANSKKTQKIWIWSVIQIFAVTAGFMTFYYFLFWVATLGVLVLLRDRKYWWHHGLRLSSGIALTTPWLLWGTRQQLNNADLERFSAASNWLEAAGRHLEGVFHTLGIQLIVGDWASILSPLALTVAGIGAIALLITVSLSLWHSQQRQILVVALVLSILPLLLMSAVDIASGKFTVGFGWGRSLIFILPGCLLLIALFLEKTQATWRTPVAVSLIILYLSLNITDFSFRSRSMFQQIAGIIEQQSAKPTLIAMNSNAWGHVLRLAYYLPSNSSVMLLAQKSFKLAPALEQTLLTQPESYQSILWLESDRPVWGSPATEAERKQVQEILAKEFQLVQTKRLLGTWELDHFTANLYQRTLSQSSIN